MASWEVNKGVGRTVEFKGLKAHYLFLFAGGLLGIFILVANVRHESQVWSIWIDEARSYKKTPEVSLEPPFGLSAFSPTQ